MRTYIEISPEIRSTLKGKYGRTSKSIWEALTFVTNSNVAKDIRTEAMRLGGRLVEENFLPNCRTEHSNGSIIQTFAGGVKVVTGNGTTQILVEDTVIAKYKDVTIESWGNVLAMAQEISQKRVFNEIMRTEQ